MQRVFSLLLGLVLITIMVIPTIAQAQEPATPEEEDYADILYSYLNAGVVAINITHSDGTMEFGQGFIAVDEGIPVLCTTGQIGLSMTEEDVTKTEMIIFGGHIDEVETDFVRISVSNVEFYNAGGNMSNPLLCFRISELYEALLQNEFWLTPLSIPDSPVEISEEAPFIIPSVTSGGWVTLAYIVTDGVMTVLQAPEGMGQVCATDAGAPVFIGDFDDDGLLVIRVDNQGHPIAVGYLVGIREGGICSSNAYIHQLPQTPQ